MKNPVQKRLLVPLIVVVVVLLSGFYMISVHRQKQDLYNQITRDIEEIPQIAPEILFELGKKQLRVY